MALVPVRCCELRAVALYTSFAHAIRWNAIGSNEKNAGRRQTGTLSLTLPTSTEFQMRVWENCSRPQWEEKFMPCPRAPNR